MGKSELPYTVGSKPNTVRIYRRPGRKSLYMRTWDTEKGRWRKKSLKHSDVEKAKEEAADLHAKLVKGEKALQGGSLTLSRLFTLYRKHRSPQKSKGEQKGDARRAKLWTRVLGSEKDPHEISRAEWEGFIEARSAGEIDARGRRKGHPEYNGQPVGPRTVERDLRFLLAVLNWAKDWRTSNGYLLRENVCRGYPVPKEKNPAQPIATDERVQKIRDVAPQVTMDVTWGEKREEVPSHLPALFELAVGTGRRLSSILALRYSDLLLDEGPHGCIRWRADTDKEGRESVVPISPRTRRTLERVLQERPGIGDAPLFPAPNDASKPVDRSRADRWLRKAETLAEVDPHDGSLWHAYRRRWATVRKHLPATDVAEAGGWAGPETLQRVYQQADPETMYEVVTSGGELREATQ